MSPLAAKLSNAVGYQAVWFCCVAGAGHQLPWAGPVASAVFVVAMLAFGGSARDDLRLLVLAFSIGFVLDTAFAASGWLRYSAAWPSADVAPAWILALWSAFAMTLNHSMGFLRNRPVVAAVLGFFGGPLAYWSAQGGFGAVAFGAPTAWVLGALAIGWAIALPLLLRLDRQLRDAPLHGHFA